MRRVAAVGGCPVAKRPGLRCEPDSRGVEGLIKELDVIKHRRVKREEPEACDRWWRDVEAELKGAALAEHTTHLEVIGRIGHCVKRRPVSKNSTAHLGQTRNGGPGVRGDRAREPTERVCRDGSGFRRRETIPQAAGERTKRPGAGWRRLACLERRRCQVRVVE